MRARHAIDVVDVCKEFQIGQSDLAAERLVALVKRIMTPWKQQREGFRALDQVSFHVPWGSTFGIVGRNGSGKSTILKVLARVTKPTSGSVAVSGRVGPLIEVGAGFHPELTGEENIYVNGTIMGMTRREIKARFDEIVAFSELEKFIRTPVKRYSSGMYVRLGFAVAVHSNPDILLIDEVLSVGDAAFQRRSLAKVQELGRQGTTVVFVSHNLVQVEQVCATTLVLKQGRIAFLGETREALDSYRHLLSAEHMGPAASIESAGSHEVILQVRLLRPDGSASPNHRSGDPLVIEADLQPPRNARYRVRVGIYTFDGLLCHETESQTLNNGASHPHPVRLELSYPSLNLADGEYRVVLGVLPEGTVAQVAPFQAVSPLIMSGLRNHRGILDLEAVWMIPPTGAGR